MKYTKTISIVAACLVLIGAVAYAGWVWWVDSATVGPPEIAAILETDNLQERTELYRNLIERVGLERGQELLFQSGLPFTGQTHLLNHTAGEMAYEQYGAEGVAHCKDYFLASCYHGAIISTISIEGLSALEDTMARCQQQGPGVASQCAHAIGHGLLAWFGYEHLPKALAQCDALGREDFDFSTFNCHDGVFMENLWAVHEGGGRSPDRWIDSDDQRYPCNDPRLKERWLDGCWSNQPAVIYQNTRGDLSTAGDVCASLTDAKLQNICFDGLARQIHPITDGDTQTAQRLCRRSVPDAWYTDCIQSIATADFSVGGRTMPFSLCETLPGEAQRQCYTSITSLINVTYPNEASARQQCLYMPAGEVRSACYDEVRK